MITQEFDINLIPNSAPVVVHLNKYDYGTGRFVISLYEEGVPYSPSNATAKIEGEKPDGNVFSYNVSLSGNVVTADVTEQMTAVEGRTYAQVIITESTGRTGSFAFWMEIQKSAIDEKSPVSETEIPAIIDGLSGEVEKARAAADSAVEAASEAENSKAEAETYKEAAAASASTASSAARSASTAIDTVAAYAQQAELSAKSLRIEIGTDVTNPSSPSEEYAAGNLYINNETNDLWRFDGTQWVLKGNFKGNTGDKGDKGDKGDPGNNWYRGHEISGKSAAPTVFSDSGIALAYAGDNYLNNQEGAIYHCVTGGDPDTATWSYDMTLSGGGGGGASDWLDIDGRPFDTIGDTLEVVNGELNAKSTGHTIQDHDTSYPQRSNLKFMHMSVRDDEENDTTIVTSLLGSIITVTTSETTLYGKEVTITDGNETLTETFDDKGYAEFDGVTFIGNITITSTDGDKTATTTGNIPYFEKHNFTLAFWRASIEVTSNYANDFMIGGNLDIYKDGVKIGKTSYSTSEEHPDGYFLCAVSAPGTYHFEGVMGWRTFKSEDLVVSEEITYTTSLNGFKASIAISTDSEEFENSTVTITSEGVPTSTVTLINGSRTYTAYKEGDYTFTINYLGDDYSNALTVSAEDNYSVKVNYWTATVNISTPTSQMHGKTITVKKDGAEIGTATFNNSGVASYAAHSTGEYTFECTLGWRPFMVSQTVSEETTYSITLNGFVAPITITTSSEELYGQAITVTATGVPTETITFSASGVATYNAYMAGTYNFAITADGFPYTDSVVVSEETSYTATLNTFNAPITITTSSEELYGATITITKGDMTTTTTFRDISTAYYTAHETGTYTFSVTYDGETFAESLTVSAEQIYTVEINTYTVYGFHVDSTNNSPSGAVSYDVQYDGKNVANHDFTPAAMNLSTGVMNAGDWNLVDDFFIPRPCMLKSDGTVDYYLDPDDYTKKEDGTASDVANTAYDGNAMLEFGGRKTGDRIYYKMVPDADPTSYTVYFSNRKPDDDFVDWSFIDANNEEIDHFYMSCFEGSNISNKLRSISGQTPDNASTGVNECTWAKANNKNGGHEWYIDVYADWVLFNLLMVLVSKSLDTQTSFGAGHNSGGTAASSLLKTGTANNKGLFYGTSGNVAVKAFGKENCFADRWDRLAGCVLSNGTLLYKLTYGTADGTTATGYNESDNAPSGWLNGGTIVTNLSQSYIIKQKAKTDGSLLMSTGGGSSSTYYCDGGWSSTGVKSALVGGTCAYGALCGRFAFNVNSAFSHSGWSGGASLSCKPLKTKG